MAEQAGIPQERLELWCEDRVAVIDRVLRITDHTIYISVLLGYVGE
jgi:hypothetical protein